MNTLVKFLEPYEKKMVKEIEADGLIVTVSGFSGTGKSTVAKMLADALGVEYYCPTEYYKDKAKETGIDLNHVVETADRKVDFEIEKKTLERGMKGGVVIDSRLAGFVLGGFANFKLFVKCSDEERDKRIAAREGFSVAEANDTLKKRDEIHEKKYKEYYGVDVHDESIYDMIIDNSGSIEDLQEKIKEVVTRIKVFG